MVVINEKKHEFEALLAERCPQCGGALVELDGCPWCGQRVHMYHAPLWCPCCKRGFGRRDRSRAFLTKWSPPRYNHGD